MPVKCIGMSQCVSGMIKRFGLVASYIQHRLKLNRLKNKINRVKDDSMGNQAVDQYLCAIWEMYQEGSKEQKGSLLDQAERITKLERKHLIKRLNRSSSEGVVRAKAPGRPAIFQRQELLPHIRYLWEQMEYISAKRFKAGFKDWLLRYKDCPAHLKMQLHRMSASTLERCLKELRAERRASKGLSTTCPARYMKNKVPINTLDAKITKPGYTQTDTLAHCGNSGLGAFISSLTVTDLYSTWTDNRAMFTKKGTEVVKNLKSIEGDLPFKLLSINSDSGSEFLNKQMLKYTGHGQRVAFTRSRHYKKNDNCYVEQKNFTHVRELFGYERFDDEHLVELMNTIYQDYWNPLQNFFIPTFKLKEKVRIGARIHKKYDAPKTPYQRLMESEHLTNKQKDDLLLRKQQLDPFELKAGLEKKLKEFFEAVRKRNIREVA
jgi:hypothetical protein